MDKPMGGRKVAARASGSRTDQSFLRPDRGTGTVYDTGTRERGKSLSKNSSEQVLEGSMTLARDADQMITARSLKSITSSPSS